MFLHVSKIVKNVKDSVTRIVNRSVNQAWLQKTKIGAILLMFLFGKAVGPPYRSRQKAAYVTTGITFRETIYLDSTPEIP